MITPIELHNRQHKAGRGYKKKEMDLFLEEVFENYEQLYKENVELKEKISRLSDGIQQYKTMENALQKALVLAEKTSKDTIESASQKAAVLEKEAKLNADTIVNNALSKSEEIKKQCILLLKQYNQFKAQYKQIALKQIELLDGDFYEIYSKDLIDAVNEASKNSENTVSEDENPETNVDGKIAEDEGVAKEKASDTEKSSSLNVAVDEDIAEGKASDTEKSSSLKVAVDEDIAEGKASDTEKSSSLKVAVDEDAAKRKASDTDDVNDILNSDTKEFTPFETDAIDRAAENINKKHKNNEKENINKTKENTIKTKENINKAKESTTEDDDEKLNRSIRKLRSQLASDRKFSGDSSSFEFFDNE